MIKDQGHDFVIYFSKGNFSKTFARLNRRKFDEVELLINPLRRFLGKIPQQVSYANTGMFLESFPYFSISTAKDKDSSLKYYSSKATLYLNAADRTRNLFAACYS